VHRSIFINISTEHFTTHGEIYCTIVHRTVILFYIVNPVYNISFLSNSIQRMCGFLLYSRMLVKYQLQFY